jgi:hypothetical protein
MKQWTVCAVVLALAGTAGAGRVAGGEDDLAIVKKAVASPPPRVRGTRVASTPAPQAAPAVAAAPTPPVTEAAPRVRAGREPQWFKVRVVERVTGRKKVTINLPLSLVRALGDDTIDWGCRSVAGDHRCHTVRLSEVLRSLETGQELVEIEDDEATVKVWVE